MPADEAQPGEHDLNALCAAFAGGDDDALEALLALHHARLRGFASRKIGPEWSPRIEADDLLQEAYVAAFAARAGFEPRGPDAFYRWMTQIVENRFFDHVRYWSRRKRDAARVVDPRAADASACDALLERCDAGESRASRFARREEAQGALLSCVARLPEEYREVVRRVMLRGEPHEAVAADMNRSAEAVRRMASRAVEKLRECLGRASRYLSRFP